MEQFPFFNLPSVVTHDILNRATPFDLFSFSLQSEEARNIIKAFSNRHKFHLEVFVNKSFLTFNQEDSKKKQLVMYAHAKHRCTEHIFHFNGRFKQVPANIEHETDETKVYTYYDVKRTDSGFKYLVEYLTSVFKNVSISLNFIKPQDIRGYGTNLIKEEKRIKGIKDLIKKRKLSIINYNDRNGTEYTFNDLKPLMKCKRLELFGMKLTNEEMKQLLDEWMDGGSLEYIRFRRMSHINLQDLTSNDVVTESPGNQHFEVQRRDGVKAKVALIHGGFKLEVI